MLKTPEIESSDSSAALDRLHRALPESSVGPIIRYRADRSPGMEYYLYAASRLRAEMPLLVAVHGIRRRAEKQARLFAPLVEAVGGMLVAPHFERKRFADYQRLGGRDKGERADLALKQVLTDIAELTGHDTRRVVMFGYSGGGQFVHRYAMANPRQVLRMAVAAPGWFTFPDNTVSYPEGIKRIAALPDLFLDPARFLQVPALALVGENDIRRDKAFNRQKRLDRQQGKTRLERGRRWIEAMAAEAARFNYKTPYVFSVIPRCGHSFSRCMEKGRMGQQVMAFLYGTSLTGRRRIALKICNHGQADHIQGD